MEYVILDLEWNGAYSHKLEGYLNEIIEIGAVKFDEDMNILGEFSVVVKPKVGKRISNKVKNLTNITNSELIEGCKFTKALKQFKNFLGSAILMTWGTSDILVLMDNNKYYFGTTRLDFIKKFVDLQRYCEYELNYTDKQQLGLSTAAQLLGITEGYVEQHRALQDSRVSFKCYEKLFNKDELEKFIQDSDCDEFYDRMAFKTTVICDLKNPLVDHSQMFFCCDVCGEVAKRVSAWNLRNKSYRADFKCKKCGYKFKGRIQFKLKYDGVVIIKTSTPWYEYNNDKTNDNN